MSGRSQAMTRGRRAARALTAALAAALLACAAQAPPPPDPDVAAMEPAVRRKIGAARQAVIAEPESAAAWGELGMVLHAHELFADAGACYRTAADLDPDDERWPYFLAVVLSVEASDFEAARAAYRRTLELRPDYAPAHLRLGDLLAGADELEAAEAAYRRALELEPELAPAELGLGRSLLRRGRAEEAVEHLEQAQAALPRSGAALDALGRAYAQVGRVEEAREIAAKARGARGFDVFADPLMSAVVAREVSSTLLWPRARQALADGRLDQALALLRRIAEQQPSDPEVHEQLGFAYSRDGKPPLAIEHLRRALALDPERHRARAQLGLLLLGRGDREGGDREEAVEQLRRAAAAEPGDGELRAHLGRALAAAGRGAEAIGEFEAAAAATDPLPAWAYHEWGLALAGQRRFGEAVERFRDALEREPDNPQGLFHLGLALEAVGRYGEAVAAYRRAMELEPNELIASRLRALGG